MLTDQSQVIHPESSRLTKRKKGASDSSQSTNLITSSQDTATTRHPSLKKSPIQTKKTRREEHGEIAQRFESPDPNLLAGPSRAQQSDSVGSVFFATAVDDDEDYSNRTVSEYSESDPTNVHENTSRPNRSQGSPAGQSIGPTDEEWERLSKNHRGWRR